MLLTFITGKLAVFFCDLCSFFLKQFCTFNFLFLEFELHRFITHNDRYALRFNLMVHYFG